MLRALYGFSSVSLFIQSLFLLSFPSRSWAESPATPAPEVFQAFAGGWLDFQDGHYIEAMRSFHDVALMDTRFSPAITGMKSSAEALKLPQISDALSEYEAEINRHTKDYGKFTSRFEPGVAFWGLYTDNESVTFSEIDQLEQVLLNAIRKTTSLEVSQISPVSYEPKDRQQVKAYSYNIIGLLSVEDDVVYLDLQLINQFDIDTTQASGVGYEVSQSIHYKQQRVSLNEGEFPEYFSSDDGEEFLQAMLTEGKAAVSGKFEPKYEPQRISEFDPKQRTVFDLIATQANRAPSCELFAKYSKEGSYDLNTKEPIIPYIYEGATNWLIGHLDQTNPDQASLMTYLLVTTHLRARSEWGQTDPQALQAIIDKYPNTPGGALAELYFLVRRLTPENIHGAVGNQIEYNLELIETHPLISKNIPTFHYWESRFHFTATNQSALLNFKYQRTLTQRVEPKPKRLRHTLPLFSHISLIYDQNSQRFQFLPQAHFPAAMIEHKSATETQAEIRYMVQFHSDYLNGEIDADALLSALSEDNEQSIYLTLLAAHYANSRGNLQIGRQALKRILQELNEPSNQRVSLQLLVQKAKQLKTKMSDDDAAKRLKIAVNNAIINTSKNTQWADIAKPKIRTLVSTVNGSPAQNTKAISDLEQRVFEVADNADPLKYVWIYDLNWYLNWLIRNKETDRVKTTLARYDAHFKETIPVSESSQALDWQVRLPLLIAIKHIQTDQFDDAQRWLQPLTAYKSILLRSNGSSSERSAEQALVQARIYLTAIHLQKLEYDQATAVIDEVIEWNAKNAVPVSKELLCQICPELKSKTISNTMEAALAIKERITNAM